MQASLGRHGLPYLGDTKRGALQRRAFRAASDNYSLCPLPATQGLAEELDRLLIPVGEQRQKLTPVSRPAETDEEPELIAEGYEFSNEMQALLEGEWVQWQERWWVVRSVAYAEAQPHSLERRLEQAHTEIAALNERRQGKKRYPDEAELRAGGEQVLARYRVKGLLGLDCRTSEQECTRRQYGTRPTRVQVERTLQITAQVEEQAVAQVKRGLGWRVYATHQPATELSREQAVLAYREEYRVERGFGRRKGKPLSLTPLYLDTDDRVTGLLRVLLIALRVLCLLEFSVRRQWQAEGEKLAGIYPGHPKRATARPTSELMLRAFEGLTLTVLEQGGKVQAHLTPLSAVQQRILQLLGLSPEIHLRLANHFSKPLLKMSEP